jgi:hypothetical protein
MAWTWIGMAVSGARADRIGLLDGNGTDHIGKAWL